MAKGIRKRRPPARKRSIWFGNQNYDPDRDPVIQSLMTPFRIIGLFVKGSRLSARYAGQKVGRSIMRISRTVKDSKGRKSTMDVTVERVRKTAPKKKAQRRPPKQKPESIHGWGAPLEDVLKPANGNRAPKKHADHSLAPSAGGAS